LLACIRKIHLPPSGAPRILSLSGRGWRWH
jgi:hypothetical protein